MADATDAELAIMQLLWQHGARTRRQLTDALYPDGGPAHYTTVQKLLERLEAKGFVESELTDGVRVFTSCVERETVIHTRLKDVADKLCGGSMAPLLLHLAESPDLSPTDVNELRQLVKRLTKPGGKV